jgi:hypothetical protein
MFTYYRDSTCAPLAPIPGHTNSVETHLPYLFKAHEYFFPCLRLIRLTKTVYIFYVYISKDLQEWKINTIGVIELLKRHVMRMKDFMFSHGCC